MSAQSKFEFISPLVFLGQRNRESAGSKFIHLIVGRSDEDRGCSVLLLCFDIGAELTQHPEYIAVAAECGDVRGSYLS